MAEAITSGSDQLATEVTVLALNGDVLAVVDMWPWELARTLKERVAAAGGPHSEHQQLLLRGEMVLDTHSGAQLGFEGGDTAEVSVASDVGEAFCWGHKGGSCDISEDRLTLTKGTSPETVGVMGAAPLPMEATWRLRFSRFGSFACAGVATAEAALSSTGYGYLFDGREEARQSWGLCVEDGVTYTARHGDATRQLDVGDLGADAQDPSKISQVQLRLSKGTELYGLLPGEGREEQLLFSGLPTEAKLYAVASTVFGNSRISIEHLC